MPMEGHGRLSEERDGPPEELGPVLPGPGASDYERYLRTDELLALQKGPGEWVHRDELLFQTVHQSSELWLKLAVTEVGEAEDGGVVSRGARARGPLPARGAVDGGGGGGGGRALPPLQGDLARDRC